MTTLTTAFALIAAFGGAIKVWPEVEPLMPAHRGYVVEQVGEYRPTINQLLKWRAQDAKQRVDQEFTQWEVKLKTESDPQTRQLIERRLQQLQQNRADIDLQIKQLGR